MKFSLKGKNLTCPLRAGQVPKVIYSAFSSKNRAGFVAFARSQPRAER
jgi:hypothetical protein